MNKRNLFIFLVIAPLFAITLAGVKVYHSIQMWRYDGPNVEFQVKPGEGFSKINYRLKKHELISSAKIFHRYAQLNGMMTKLKAGNYIIKTDSNMINVINTLFFFYCFIFDIRYTCRNTVIDRKFPGNIQDLRLTCI